MDAGGILDLGLDQKRGEAEMNILSFSCPNKGGRSPTEFSIHHGCEFLNLMIIRVFADAIIEPTLSLVLVSR